MQSTKSTIQENWPGPITTEPPRGPIYHFALMQSEINIDFHLERFLQRGVSLVEELEARGYDWIKEEDGR